MDRYDNLIHHVIHYASIHHVSLGGILQNIERTNSKWQNIVQRIVHANTPPFHWLAKLGMDALTWLLATPLALLILFDGAVPVEVAPRVLFVTLLLFSVKLVAAMLFALPRDSWVRITFRDMGNVARFAGVVALAGSALLLWLGPALGLPRSLGLVDALLTLFGMLAVRAGARAWREQRVYSRAASKMRKRVLLIGAGEAGHLLVREMLRHPETGLLPVGFLDDAREKHGTRIATVPVLGGLGRLEEVLEKERVGEVLIAIPSLDGRTVRGLVDRIKATGSGVNYRIMPGVYELLSGKVGIKRLREVDIEDLLRRPPIELDSVTISGYLEGKTVMVTGAGGSIGSELIRQICRFKPKELILFGHGENSIYKLERELDRDWPDIPYRSVIGAVQNVVRLDYVFRHYKPQVVFHAAAHKHVPLMEMNPEEAVFNNIIGSKNLVTLALKYGVSHFVNISTDKAVNPSSVMGASKRMVERVVQSAARQTAPSQMFVSVRFGNVLGSRGSVIPVFKHQIKAGGPVTVTHPEMTRYFMTIPEATQLVLQAAGQGQNGEIYILDMGEPVRIVDLARDLIRLSGLEPDVDIDITFSGMRPGEKLAEELMTEEERGGATPHQKIFVAQPSPLDVKELEHTLQALQEAALTSDHLAIRQRLQEYISGCRLEGVAIEA